MVFLEVSSTRCSPGLRGSLVPVGRSMGRGGAGGRVGEPEALRSEMDLREDGVVPVI